MAAEDPAAIERRMYVDMHLGGVDDPALSIAELRYMGGGGVNAHRAATAHSAANFDKKDRAVDNVSATQVVMRKLVHGENVNIGIASDSTGNDTTDWPFIFAQKLGDLYTAFTVKVYPAEATGNGYGAPTTVKTGSGPNTLSIYNQSIPGQNAYAWQGANFTPQWLVADLDLVIISTGHNEGLITGDPSTLGTPKEQLGLRLQAFTETLRAFLPQTAILLIGQHAWQDNTGDQDIKRDVYRALAMSRGYGFIDMYERWNDSEDKDTFYADNVHPNAAGGAFYATEILRSFVYAPLIEPLSMPPSLLLSTVTSVCDDLVLPLGATTPISWSVGNATVTRDAAVFERARGYSVKIVRTAGGSTSRIFRQVLNSVEILPHRGKYVTILVRMRRPAKGLGSRFVGVVAVSDGVLNSKTFADDYSYGDWIWRTLAHKVSDTATSLTLSIYADGTVNGSAAAGEAEITVDRVIIAPGITFAGWGTVAGARTVRDTARHEGLILGDPAMSTAPVLDLDAASGIPRSIRFLTANVVRWIVNAQSTETGSNVGSDLLWQARADAGGFIATAMTMKRQSAAVEFDGTHIKAPRFTTATRPNAGTAGVGAQIFDTTLVKPLWSNGTAWIDSTGTVV